MATEALNKVTSQIALDNGTDSEGNQRTVNVSLARMSSSGYDASKYLAIVAALEPCLDKTVYRVGAVKTYTVTS